MKEWNKKDAEAKKTVVRKEEMKKGIRKQGNMEIQKCGSEKRRDLLEGSTWPSKYEINTACGRTGQRGQCTRRQGQRLLSAWGDALFCFTALNFACVKNTFVLPCRCRASCIISAWSDLSAIKSIAQAVRNGPVGTRRFDSRQGQHFVSLPLDA